MTKSDEVRRIGTSALAIRIDRSPVTIWRMVKTEKLPAPHFIGSRKAWFLSEIEEWERQQMARPRPTRRPGQAVKP